MADRFRQLIASDNLEKAIDELISRFGGSCNDLTNQLTEFQATLAKNKKDHRRGLISDGQQNRTRTRVRIAVLEMLTEMKETTKTSIVPHLATVFISYSHHDSEVANRLKQVLEKNGCAVRFDETAMQAGEDIQEFIENSIRDSDVTVSIVSNCSLLSAWVALESIETFYGEKFEKDKKFIACYIDDDFFQTDFRLKATEQIDAKIAEIDRLIPKYQDRRIDTNDLNSQKTRLYKLRNNLGDILLRLKESLCLDIRGGKFDKSVAKILKAIT